MVVHMRVFFFFWPFFTMYSDPYLTLRLFVCSLACFVDSDISAPHLEAAFATQVSVCLFIWWCIGRIAFAGYPKRKNILPIYVFRVLLFLTQLRPASSEDCQHVLWSAIFSSRTWTYVTWSLGRRSNCVWTYSRWLERLSWVGWEDKAGEGGWGRLILFCFRPIVLYIFHLGSNKACSQEASREKETILTFCEQNIVDLKKVLMNTTVLPIKERQDSTEICKMRCFIQTPFWTSVCAGPIR